MNCPRCGASAEGVKFCPECGMSAEEFKTAAVAAKAAPDVTAQGAVRVLNAETAKPKRKMIWERHPAIIALAIILIMVGVAVAAILIVSLMFFIVL